MVIQPTVRCQDVDNRCVPNRLTRSAARRAIFNWIEGVHDRRRLHSALGSKSPATFKEGLTSVKLVA